MKNLFKKRSKPEAHIKVSGISEDDWRSIHNKINEEYLAAHDRQKNPGAAPNPYMKGLLFAMEALESVRPYDLAEVLK